MNQRLPTRLQPMLPYAWWSLPLAVLGLFALLAWGAWGLYQEREQRYQHQVEGGLSAINQLQTKSVADWRRRRVGEALALTDDALLARALAHWRAEGDGAAQEAVRERLRALVEYQQYTAALVVDTRGQLLLGAQGPVAGQLPGQEAQALVRALADAQPVVIGLRREPDVAHAFYSVLAPLYAGDKPLGAIWLQMDARTSLYPLLETWPYNSVSAESLLVEREGDVLAFLSPLRQRSDAPLTLRLPLVQQGDATVLLAVQGVRGTLYGSDYRGEQVLATASAVPESDWLLISKIDTAEAFTDVRRREWMALGLFALLALLSLGCVVVFWQWRAWWRERVLKERLQQTMRWVDAAQKAAQVGYFYYDTEYRRFTLSHVAAVIFGIPQDKPLSVRQWVALLHPDDRAQVLRVHGQVLAERGLLRMQYRIQHEGAKEARWVQVWGEFDTSMGLQRAQLTGTVQDITVRKRAEEQLERYRQALEARVRLDTLTQVANRLALDEAVAEEWARARRSGGALALLMVDVDFFKAFNDHYGHVAGDRCLQGVAAALSGTMGRAGDLVARYGGEEFAVLLPGASAEQACAVAERLCAAVRALAVVHAGGGDSGMLSISVGVASVLPAEPGPGPERATGVDAAYALFQQADAALYRAKQVGRDQWVLYGPDCRAALHQAPARLFQEGGDSGLRSDSF